MSSVTNRVLGALVLGVVIAMPAWPQEPAAAPATGAAAAQPVVEEWMFGYEILNEAEREAYRERVRNAATDEAREQFRRMHRAEMLQRARERGVTLATQAPAAPAPAPEAAPQP